MNFRVDWAMHLLNVLYCKCQSSKCCSSSLQAIQMEAANQLVQAIEAATSAARRWQPELGSSRVNAAATQNNGEATVNLKAPFPHLLCQHTLFQRTQFNMFQTPITSPRWS